jgi:hypothetical protein
MSPIGRFLVVMLLCAAPAIQAQFNVMPGGTPRPLGKDTICFRYDLRAGDTLVYRIEAHDSVNVENGQRFYKERTETVRIVCDSVTRNGIMFLSTTLLTAKEINVMGADTSVRTTHPWVGRRHVVAIDAVGHRIMAQSDNDSVAGTAPGGTMQPLLLPVLDTSCGVQNQAWLAQDTLILVENAVPNPVLSQQVYWRVLDKGDTLGRTVNRIQYTQTAVGSVVLLTKDLSIDASTVLAGYGRLTFDRKLNVILHQFATVENKFTMQLPNDIRVRGKHLISENVTLVSLSARDRRRSWRLPKSKR